MKYSMKKYKHMLREYWFEHGRPNLTYVQVVLNWNKECNLELSDSELSKFMVFPELE